MATTTLSPNLKLRISSDLTNDSKFNLNRIDTLGSLYQTDTNDAARIRSKSDIYIQPNDPDIGGVGSGGTVFIGTTDQPVTNLQINATSVSFSSGLTTKDTATGGDKSLILKYKSDINGVVDTGADRNLSFDLEGGDRNITIGLDLSLTGSGNLSLSLPSSIDWELPSGNGTNGQVLTTDGAGVLSWTNAAATNLTSLADVTLTSPTNGQALVFNSTTSQWENGSVTGVIGAETAFTWTPADGSVKTINHNLGSQQVLATVIDTADNYRTVEIPDTTRPDGNTIVLTSTSAPVAGNWLVLLKQIIT